MGRCRGEHVRVGVGVESPMHDQWLQSGPCLPMGAAEDTRRSGNTEAMTPSPLCE